MVPRAIGWRVTLALGLATLAIVPATGVAQSRGSVEDRLQRLERQVDSNALLDLLERVERLQREVRDLRGETEQQADAVADIGRRQREQFLELDRRLKQLESGTASGGAAAAPPPPAARPPGAATPGPTAPPGATAAPPPATAKAPAASAEPPPAAAGADPIKEQAAYQQAFNLLKEGRYEEAAKSFTGFLKTYPSGRYSDNAQYWLGESYYVNRQLQPALAEFKKLVQGFPGSAKVSHAQLKIGLIYSETGELEQARKVLSEVAKKYPNTPQARLAQERLEKLQSD